MSIFYIGDIYIMSTSIAVGNFLLTNSLFSLLNYIKIEIN